MPKTRFQLVVTDEASSDLLEIALYLADENPVLAMRTVRKLRAEAVELADRALRYALVPRHEETGVRRRVAGAYNIYYHVSGDRVEVLRFLHHARDSEQVLFPEDD